MKVKKSKVDNKISILVDEGYPRKQAVAIALAMEQKGKLQQGGQIPESNDDTIKDKKYQKLLKAFRKADAMFYDSNLIEDLDFDKKKQKAVDAEAELDAYCREKGYNQEMGWM